MELKRPHHQHDWPGEFTYCPHCATRLQPAQRHGKTRPTCPECDFIHWRNPAVGAAAVVFEKEDQILLVRRAPGATQAGLWSIPAGFVDYGEEVRAAAQRELAEETGLIADIGDVVWVASNFHDPGKLTVGIWFAAAVTGGTLQAGDDADDARFFPLSALPPLAFETDEAYLASVQEDQR
jgi:ADP-ribose pyrophosphatase YjhB (NUDIX family)